MISASACLSSQPDTAVQTADELPLHHVVGHHHWSRSTGFASLGRQQADWRARGEAAQPSPAAQAVNQDVEGACDATAYELSIRSNRPVSSASWHQTVFSPWSKRQCQGSLSGAAPIRPAAREASCSGPQRVWGCGDCRTRPRAPGGVRSALSRVKDASAPGGFSASRWPGRYAAAVARRGPPHAHRPDWRHRPSRHRVLLPRLVQRYARLRSHWT